MSLPALPSALADVDADGDLDAVFAGAPTTIQLFDDDDFLPGTASGIPLSGAFARADVDGDGDDEIVSGGAVGTVTNLLQGVTTSGPVLTGGTPVPHAGDFNGDGRDEILWSRVDGTSEIWWSW